MSTHMSTATSAVERQTYWCHECDMSVHLLSTTTTATTNSIRCPQCRSDFLEEMDSPLAVSDPNPNRDSNISLLASLFNHPFPQMSPPETPTITTVDNFEFAEYTTLPFPAVVEDNYLLSSPYFQRLVQQISNSDSSDSPSPTLPHHLSPASKSAVEAIPIVTISAGLLSKDPVILCAVCKDQFLIDVEVRQLPCKHMYHSDCILPWLKSHNSCPVCRFQLPTERDEDPARERRRERYGAVRLGELMSENEDLFGIGSTLRHIVRRHRMGFPPGRQSGGVEDSLSPTQIGEAEVTAVERANSVETVSSWPVEGGGISVGGDGDIGVSRVNDIEDSMVS